MAQEKHAPLRVDPICTALRCARMAAAFVGDASCIAMSPDARVRQADFATAM
jgi:hypothetical protein